MVRELFADRSLRESRHYFATSGCICQQQFEWYFYSSCYKRWIFYIPNARRWTLWQERNIRVRCFDWLCVKSHWLKEYTILFCIFSACLILQPIILSHYFWTCFVNWNFGSLETCVIDLMQYCVTSKTLNSVLGFWGNPFGSVFGVLISLIFLELEVIMLYLLVYQLFEALCTALIMTVRMKHFNILINKIFMYVSVWKFYGKDSNWFVHILS